MTFHSVDGLKLPGLVFRSMLLVVLVFQATALKYIWGLEDFSRFINLLLLAGLLLYILIGVFKLRLKINLWLFCVFPSVFIVCGVILNLIMNYMSGFSNFALFGFVIPWIAMISVPIFSKRYKNIDEKLWKAFYYFMIFCVVSSLLDIFLLYYGYNSLNEIETSGGDFSAGYFTLFYKNDFGIVELRNYSSFLEPGSFAMFLLPAIAWSIYNRRYLGFFVLMVGMLSAQSLGAFVSLFFLFFSIYMVQGNSSLAARAVGLLLLVSVSLSVYGYLEYSYENKGGSRETRVTNIEDGFSNLGDFFISKPLGFSFNSNSLDNDDGSNSYATVMPIYYFVVGGVFGFLGYLAFLLVLLFFVFKSFFIYKLSLYEKVISVCILPAFVLIFQRSTIFESAVFALLFFPTIYRRFESERAV